MILDVFEDAGLDLETRSFLVEALLNADDTDWLDILEPFLPPSHVLSAVEAAKRTVLVEAEKELDMLRLVQPETCDRSGPDAHGHHDDENLGDQTCIGVSLVLSREDVVTLCRECIELGFSNVSEGLYCLLSEGMTLELNEGESLAALMDHQCAAEVHKFLVEYVQCRGFSGLVDALVTWRRASRDSSANVESASDDASSDGDCADDIGFDPRLLPTCGELGVNVQRKLTILTWGFFKLDKAPPADALINCAYKKFHYLTRNNKHIKKLTGLDDVVQGRVCRNTFFPVWLASTVARIERNNLQSVSFCCAKGTHLSVAIAEMMKKAYYPHASITHLTIAANRPGHSGGPRRH